MDRPTSDTRLPTERPLELEQRFPQIAGRLSRLCLTALPTRVHLWRAASAVLGQEVWIKRDDETSPIYGGNKPRKLEFLLGEAMRRGYRGLLTFGGLGTHHGLATAIFARRYGMSCCVGLLEQPVTAEVRRNLLRLHAAGARLFYAGSVGALVARSLWLYLRQLAQGTRLGVVPTGGSSAAGTVGFVNAAFELARQIEQGECPRPATVYVALGSGGTAAGLALGFALAGLPIEVRAVLVSDILAPGEDRLRRLARGALRWLKKAGASLPSIEPPDWALKIVRNFVGRGYGWPLPEAAEWRRRVGTEDGISLEPTYTEKCFAALCAEAGQGARNEPVLFWHTYSRARPEDTLGPLPQFEDLPEEFHRFFQAGMASDEKAC